MEELPNIVDSIKLYLLKNGTPSLDEVCKIQKIILEYVKTKGRTIYGGYALNLLVGIALCINTFDPFLGI